MSSRRKPTARIWVESVPLSSGAKSAGPSGPYREAIAKAAKEVLSKPISSPRIDIEIWYGAKCFDRADVDNILKPILDALKGVVFNDDGQVRSVKATALPNNDAYRITSWTNEDLMVRVTNADKPVFLIDVFEGLEIEGPAS